MATYSMTCSCGDVMTTDAADRDAAVKQLQGIMTQDAVEQHFAQKHPTDTRPALADVHAMIAQVLTPA